MSETILLEKASIDNVESFYKAVDKVVKERKFSPATAGFPLEKTRQFVENIIDNNYPQYYAIENGEVVAWCDIIPKPFEDMKHVGSLGMGMLSDYRGNGIGTKLMKKTIEHAKKVNKIERVELEVYESNRYGIELYRRMGFNVEGRKQYARKIDDEYDNIIVMGKILK